MTRVAAGPAKALSGAQRHLPGSLTRGTTRQQHYRVSNGTCQAALTRGAPQLYRLSSGTCQAASTRGAAKNEPRTHPARLRNAQDTCTELSSGTCQAAWTHGATRPATALSADQRHLPGTFDTRRPTTPSPKKSSTPAEMHRNASFHSKRVCFTNRWRLTTLNRTHSSVGRASES